MSFLKDLTGLLGTAISGFGGLGDLFTSDDERGKNQNELARIKMQGFNDVLKLGREYMAHEKHMNETSKSVMVAEIQSQSWLTRNVRPLVLVGCLLFMMGDGVLKALGVAWWGGIPHDLAEHIWTIIGVLVSVYTISRGSEKVVRELVKRKSSD